MKELEKQLKRIADLMEQMLEQQCYPIKYIAPLTGGNGTSQYCCDCQSPNTPPFVGDCFCDCHPKITVS